MFWKVITYVNVRKTVYMDMSTDIGLFGSPELTVRFLFMGLYGEKSAQKEGGYTSRISR
jgi:hypothetical protein